jgi:hypothetical protein
MVKIMIEGKISSASKFNRLFQCLVIILANYRSGVPIDDDFRARPICKCEGGHVCQHTTSCTSGYLYQPRTQALDTS